MRRFIPFLTLVVAACATTPQPAPGPVAATPSVRQAGGMVGLTADELVQRLGPPSFQVREGVGLKLQFARAGCVLDAYLYPPAIGGGIAHVSHVDTRRPSGEDVPQANCIAALTAR